MCFALFTGGNVILFADMVVLTNTNLALWRKLLSLIGALLLLHGLIWEKKGTP